MRAALLLALTCGALVACDPSRGATLRRGTPVVAISSPLELGIHRFGTQLTVTRDPVTGQRWLVVAGDGVDTQAPVASLPLSVNADDNLSYAPGSPHALCVAGDPCGANGGGGGQALAAMESWAATIAVSDAGVGDSSCGTPSPTGCALTGSLGRGPVVAARCFATNGCDTTFSLAPVAPATAQGFGASVATLPIDWRSETSRASADVAFIGATEGAGRVFASLPGRLNELTPAGLPITALFGRSLAAVRERDGSIVLAVGAPGLRSVYVYRGDGVTMNRTACALRSEVDGFGARVALGDVDGDGLSDVVVAGTPGQSNAPVMVLPASGAPADPACADQNWGNSMRYDCGDDAATGVQCGGFGASLLAADFDGDGVDEVVVGAPGARVDGAAGAGAVWVLRVSSGEAGMGRLVAASTMRHSEVQAGEGLGTSLATWGTTSGRTELAAGAPGVERAYLFYCSGIPGDQPGVGGLDGRCQPTR